MSRPIVAHDSDFDKNTLVSPDGESYLRQGDVRVWVRDAEDEDGVLAVVRGGSVLVQMADKRTIPTARRDVIEIDFMDEMGGEDGRGVLRTLRIEQIKGCTYLGWVKDRG
jgi:hypothetical protein